MREAGERLELAIGVQHAVAENFTGPETLRVELTPLVGEVVVFSLDAGGGVGALDYGGETYLRSGISER